MYHCHVYMLDMYHCHVNLWISTHCVRSQFSARRDAHMAADVWESGRLYGATCRNSCHIDASCPAHASALLALLSLPHMCEPAPSCVPSTPFHTIHTPNCFNTPSQTSPLTLSWPPGRWPDAWCAPAAPPACTPLWHDTPPAPGSKLFQTSPLEACCPSAAAPACRCLCGGPH